MNNNIEILAPAGSMEGLKAAVFSGCDAVYMGGKAFSARAGAQNFDNDEMKEALVFCHERGVKVYVTFNTLIKEEEISEAVEYIKFFAGVGVDGVLVQDMGLLRLIQNIAPSMPIHTSTQLSIHTKEGVKFLEDIGAERVVLAREMSLEEMKEVRSGTKVELEAFVHGAHCMSVSGQCYLSAVIGQRSGNRGRCAQPCRLPFDNHRGNEYSLSLKDMSLTNYISKMEEIGIASAKIEGRLKRPEYVAAAVDAVRDAKINGKVDSDKYEVLKNVFSRQGFTDGYLTGKRGKSMYGIRTKEDVVSGNKEVFGKLHSLYKNEGSFVPLYGSFTMKENEKAVLTLWDDEGNTVTVKSENTAEKALNKPLDEEKALGLIGKMGSTPYHLESLSVELDGVSTLPASAVNALRREAVESLNTLRGKIKPYEIKDYRVEYPSLGKRKIKELVASFKSASQVPENADKLNTVYIPVSESLSDFLKLKEKGINIAASLPRCYFGGEKEIESKIKLLLENGINVFEAGNLGAAALVIRLGGVCHGSFSLNITNSEALKFYEDMGLERAELSFELHLKEIEEIKGSLKRGIMLYGRQSLMLLRNCPTGEGRCIGCKERNRGENTAYITDRMGLNFPVICEKGEKYHCIELLNSLPLSLSEKQKEINNCDYGILRFTVESSVESYEVINALLNGEKLRENKTFGLFYRGVL